MTKIIAAIDGSHYADSVCNAAIWASNRTKQNITLLHTIKLHSNIANKVNLSGSIGLDAKSNLLQELTEIDEARGKIELKKGLLILEHAKKELALKDIKKVEILHRHGSLVETMVELESKASLVIMGKRGESHNHAPSHLGSNLERIARSIYKAILVVNDKFKKINNFLIAYDGSITSQKSLEYVINNPLLKGLKCYLLMVASENESTKSTLKQAEEKLILAGFDVNVKLIAGNAGNAVSDIIANYAKSNIIDLLVIGAYGHSKIRNMILGSVTTLLIKKSDIHVLLLR